MSIVEQLQSSAANVEGVRDGLGRLRGALEQTESVLNVADDVLGKADEVLVQAADALESSKRWAPRIALVLGVIAVAAVGIVVVTRLRKRDDED
jgi:hypothetical protein